MSWPALASMRALFSAISNWARTRSTWSCSLAISDSTTRGSVVELSCAVKVVLHEMFASRRGAVGLTVKSTRRDPVSGTVTSSGAPGCANDLIAWPDIFPGESFVGQVRSQCSSEQPGPRFWAAM